MFKSANIEPLEIKFSKLAIKALSETLNKLKLASIRVGMMEPNLHLFIIKQAFVTGINAKMGFGWSDTKARPRTPSRKLPQVTEAPSRP